MQDTREVSRFEIPMRPASVAHINHELVKPSVDLAGLWIVYYQQCRPVYPCILHMHVLHLYLTDCLSPVSSVLFCGLRFQQPHNGELLGLNNSSFVSSKPFSLQLSISIETQLDLAALFTL